MLPQMLLVVLCGGYAIGAAFGWGSEQVALFMGDFGLSLAGVLAAASCLRYARAHRPAPNSARPGCCSASPP